MRVAEILLVEVSSNMHVFLIFTAVDCGTMTNPNNGQVSHTGETTFGQSATYSCNTGYNLVGGSIRMCQATGEWSGSASTCQSMLFLSVDSF